MQVISHLPSFTTLSSIISLNNIFFCSSGENFNFTDSNLKFFTSSSSRFLYSRIILGDKTEFLYLNYQYFFLYQFSIMVGPDETGLFPLIFFSKLSDFILLQTPINAGVPTTLSSSNILTKYIASQSSQRFALVVYLMKQQMVLVQLVW